jgi:hypothetical protein
VQANLPFFGQALTIDAISLHFPAKWLSSNAPQLTTRFTDVFELALGALATQSCESTDEHYGYHDRDHYDHDRYLPRRPIRREQLPLGPPVDRRAFLNKRL